MELVPAVRAICKDWATQVGGEGALSLQLPDQPLWVDFEAEHLRRVLVNLLDNAQRYASLQPEAIQVQVRPDAQDQVLLSVWSDGAPMEPSVEQHLFEPFFSSESRSSGLGLYICRSLCESHHAHIAYRRVTQTARGLPTAGNAFEITLRRLPLNATMAP
jgi:two-component system sensor histidine kinase PilS (NtrC family)